MMGKKEQRKNHSCHHIIGVKYKDKFNVEISENKKIITQGLHDAFNLVFNTNQSPREQFQVILDLTRPTLSKQVIAELERLIALPDHSFYFRKLVK